MLCRLSYGHHASCSTVLCAREQRAEGVYPFWGDDETAVPRPAAHAEPTRRRSAPR